MASSGTDPDTRFTQLTAALLTDPQPVSGTDGAFHVAYELLLTNSTPLPADITRVEVRDGRTHQPILTLAGQALVEQMNPIAVTAEDSGSATIAPSGVSIVWIAT